MKNTLILTTTCLSLMAIPLSANFAINFDTDAAGIPIAGAAAAAGSFTGPGTVTGGIVTGTGGTAQIVGVGDGAVLSTNIVPNPSADHDFTNVLGMDTTFNLVGGTADIGFQSAGGGTNFKGWNAQNMAGVTEISITSIFTEAIHGREDKLTQTKGFPWGISTELLTSGTGLADSDFSIIYKMSGLEYWSNPYDPGTAVSGIPSAIAGTMTSLTSAGHWENETLGTTSLEWESTDGFTSSGTGQHQRHLVRGLNADGAGSLTATDLTSFRATTFEVIITAAPGKTFAADTNFVFSYDGDVVPEPTSGFLISLTGLGLIARRKR